MSLKLGPVANRSYGSPPEVRAGGGVVWRVSPSSPEASRFGSLSDLEVVLVHHSLHRDWSLPKGKQDPGEDVRGCAVREVHEETGLICEPDDFLAAVHYVDRIGRSKVVHYWSMHAGSNETLHVLSPSYEIDHADWVTLPDALPEVSMGRDRMVLWAFASVMSARIEGGTTTPVAADTPKAPILVVRHSSAGDRSNFHGDDAARELDKKGRAQADALPARIGAFPVTRVLASPAVRCVQSVQPYASARDLEVEIEPRLAEGMGGGVDDLLAELAGEGVVLCTHGDVVESALAGVAQRGAIPLPGDGDVRKGSIWVLNSSGEGSRRGAFRVAGFLAPSSGG